jgi:hypothetical protein
MNCAIVARNSQDYSLESPTGWGLGGADNGWEPGYCRLSGTDQLSMSELACYPWSHKEDLGHLSLNSARSKPPGILALIVPNTRAEF